MWRLPMLALLGALAAATISGPGCDGGDGDADADGDGDVDGDGDGDGDGDADGGDGGDCVAEGGSGQVLPGSPTCCEGLTQIGCHEPDETGTCPPMCSGGFFCTRCPNGTCEPPENYCNCEADCPKD